MIAPLVRYFLRQYLDRHPRTPQMVHGDALRSVAVITDHDEKHFPMVHQYVQELRKSGIKQVDLYVLFRRHRDMAFFQPKMNDFPFSTKSFTWAGRYNTPELKHSLTQQYDVLMDLSRAPALEIDILVARVNARWKAGTYDTNRMYLLDFMINHEKHDQRMLIHHMNHYIRNFNTAKAS